MVLRVAVAMVSSVLVIVAPVRALAEEAKTDTLHINDEETQLAKRFSVRESVELPYEYSLGVGRRRDSLKWSIANGGVNVASELEWNKTIIEQIRFAGRANLGSGWYVRGAYDTGAVKSGDNRDSDYAGSNRTQEYSRSESQTGGAAHDISLGIGKRAHFFNQLPGGGVSVAPLLGVSIHQQSLIMYNGHQTIPFNAPLTGQSNNYDAQWKGYWAGMDVQAGLGSDILILMSAEYHRADYTAEANWNLRKDLAHPVSFRHVAKGNGKLLSAAVSYKASRNVMVNLGLERQLWKTKNGSDQTFFSYGGSSTYTLNPVQWQSVAVFAGFVYLF